MMREVSLKLIVLIGSLCLALTVQAQTVVQSRFGFSVELPKDWFMLDSASLAKASQDVNDPRVLNTTNSAAVRELNSMLERVKSGDTEAFYDNLYLNKEYKNHITVQKNAPFQITSVQQVKSECDALPNELKRLFGQGIRVLSCQLGATNGRPVFHYAYRLPQGITIIQENTPVNSEYSVVFVGGSGNDQEGLRRLRATQQLLLNGLTQALSAKK